MCPRHKPVPDTNVCKDLQVLYGMMLHPLTAKIQKPIAMGEEYEEELVSPTASPKHSRSRASSVESTASTSSTERLTSRRDMNLFYKKQASVYDNYRHRMLHGRPGLMNNLPFRKDAVWLDIGGGTGFNTEYVRSWIDNDLKHVYILDVCDALLDQARQRVEANNWQQKVTLLRRDVCDPNSLKDLQYRPTIITFSYSLTMIPQWEEALLNAIDILAPGGFLGVTDFTVTPEQSAVSSWFWQYIFSHDGVHLRPEHRKVLNSSLATKVDNVGSGGFPYVPFLRCKYYTFVGQKHSEGTVA